MNKKMNTTIRKRILKRELEKALSEGLPFVLIVATIILFYSFK